MIDDQIVYQLNRITISKFYNITPAEEIFIAGAARTGTTIFLQLLFQIKDTNLPLPECVPILSFMEY